MISVVIPLYNKEKLIGKTLRSVLDQTYQDFEIVVVNDGSTDNSVAEVEKIADLRIRLIHQQNAGVSAARNKGITEAKGEFIALLDGDDLWKPDFLSIMIDMVSEYPQCNVFACSYDNYYPNGVIEHLILNKIPFIGKTGVLYNYFEVAACSHPPICSISIMARKSVFKTIGGFPIGIKSGEDLLTWARLAATNKIAYCLTPLAIYNMGEGYDYSKQPPRRQDEKDPVGKELKNIYREHKCVGLKQYISHWHKMRASVAIRYFDRTETLLETIKGLYYNPLNTKIYPFLILPFLPKPLLLKIFSKHK